MTRLREASAMVTALLAGGVACAQSPPSTLPGTPRLSQPHDPLDALVASLRARADMNGAVIAGLRAELAALLEPRRGGPQLQGTRSMPATFEEAAPVTVAPDRRRAEIRRLRDLIERQGTVMAKLRARIAELKQGDAP